MYVLNHPLISAEAFHSTSIYSGYSIYLQLNAIQYSVVSTELFSALQGYG